MKFCACGRFVRSEGHVVRRSGSISGFNGNPLTGEAHDSRRDRQKLWLLEHTPRISRDQLDWRDQPRAMRHHAPHMASRATARSPGESRSPRSNPLCRSTKFRTCTMVRLGADDDGWSLLGGALIGERKADEDDVAKLKGGHTRHRPGCPRAWQTPPPKRPSSPLRAGAPPR